MRFYYILICLLLPFSGFAQYSNLSGEIADNEGKALPYATVVLLNPSDSTMEFFGISDEAGHWEIKSVKSGDYLMQFAFLGFETVYRTIKMPYEKGDYWGIMAMKPQAVNLDGVQVIGEHVPLNIKKDTIEFNAKAFKTKPDAVVEDLLKKLPGLEVDRAGNIKAMGEQVRKVLVDGKEFFGNDPKVATKNVPAEAVDKVQVFDKKSEEEEFTGIDDGSRNQALNLVLKEDHKKGVFGHIMGGYGTNNHYQGNAKIYRFTDKVQMAALGMQNNVNKYGFSFQDYMDFNGGMGNMMSGGGSARIAISMDNSMPIDFGQAVNGLSTSGAGGANFSYAWNQKRRVFISYLANGTKKSLERTTQTQHFIADGDYDQNEEMSQTQRDTAHNLNFGVRYELDSTSSFYIDGNASMNFSNAWGQSYTNTLTDDLLMNYLDRNNNQGSERINTNANASWLKTLNNRKTIAKIAGGFNYSINNSRLDWRNQTWYNGMPAARDESLYQRNEKNTMSYNASASITQKLGKKYFLIGELGMRSSNENLVRSQGFIVPSDAQIDSLSPVFDRSYEYIKPGLTIKRSTDNTTINLSLRGEMNQTGNSLWDDQAVSDQGLYLLPGFVFDHEYKSGRRINLMYQTSVNQPSANQLLPIADNTNSLAVSYGNRYLKPEYQHNLFGHWMIFDQFSFTSFFSSLGVTYTKDKINWSRTIDDQLGQTLNLVNVEDDINARASFDFSTPIRKLGVKINTGVSETWNRGINLVNGTANINTNWGHRVSLSVENRKKGKWDIVAGGSLRITDARYSVQQNLNTIYTDYSYYTEIRFNPNDSWNFFASADVTNYNDKSFGESLTVPLIAAEISYFFLANKRASISIQGADLLNQNKGIQRISELNYLRETRSNIIGRYVMLSFKYRLNKFGSNNQGISIKAHR